MDVEGLDGGIVDIFLKDLQAAVPYINFGIGVFRKNGFNVQNGPLAFEINILNSKVASATFMHHPKKPTQFFTSHVDINEVGCLSIHRLVRNDIPGFVNDFEVGNAG